MITHDTYGKIVVMGSLITLLVFVICSFVVSFQMIDLLYALALIVFLVKYNRLK